MSVFDKGFKFSREFLYLTEGETTVFKRMRAKGQLTFFQVMTCIADGCDNDVPNSTSDNEDEYIKPYCSRTCWADTEGDDHDGHDEDEENW